jgi:hypothetical protein
MNYKVLVVLLYMFGYVMKTKYKNLEFFTTFFFALLLVIVNLQNCFIFLFLGLNCPIQWYDQNVDFTLNNIIRLFSNGKVKQPKIKENKIMIIINFKLVYIKVSFHIDKMSNYLFLETKFIFKFCNYIFFHHLL